MRLRRALVGDGPTDSRARAGRVIWPVLASVVFVGVLFVAVFPTQTYLGQRDEVAARRAELDAVEADNAELRSRVEALEDHTAIELLARQEWGLVYPGEEAYAVVGLEGVIEVPDVWPFDALADQLAR
jgi:cell division protein FtsB